MFYSSVSKSFNDGDFGTGTLGSIVYNLGCIGNENDIVQCRGTWGTSVSTSVCSHKTDAGVNCGRKWFSDDSVLVLLHVVYCRNMETEI